MARPIRLKTHRVLIDAPREMIFQKMSSFGRGRLKGGSGESSRVLSREGDEVVAEFTTRAGPFTYVTVERVTLHPPERITFNHLKGPLHYAKDEFTLNEVDGRTELVHHGEFIWKQLPLLGWLGGILYTRPTFERVMVKHMAQIKETCEARSERSHVFRRR